MTIKSREREKMNEKIYMERVRKHLKQMGKRNKK